MLSASAGLKKAHMTKNAGFYIVSLVGKVLNKNKPIRTVVDLFAGTEAVGYGAFPFVRWEEMQKVSLP